MTTLEKGAVLAWKAWGTEYAQYTCCHGCGEMRYCRAKRRHGRWLCLDCFDVS